MENKIDIVMAVHNGSRFIQEQIESIMNQSYKNWRLIVRDEVSTDNTLELLRKFKEILKERIVIVHDDIKRGACQNFAKALELSDGDYTMFCDQDDFWLPEKIWKTYEKMMEMESRYGKEIPIYVYTDLTVVDSKLRIINDSFWKYQKLNPENGKNLAKLMTYNVTTACTAMINRCLRELAIPIPKEAIMHDCWCAMVASVFGKVGYLDMATILYRQHGENDSGARQYNLRYIIKKTMEYVIGVKKEVFEKGEIEQAEVFLKRYRDLMAKRDIHVIEDFLSLRKKRFFRNRVVILKNGFFKPGFLRNIGLLLKA